MLRTPLHDHHLKQGAKMVDFAGWEMPIMYKWPDEIGGGGGIHDEHKQVRTSGGFFDVSHMGRVHIKGRHARRLVERLVSRRVSDMQPVHGDGPGQCRYAFVCNERGGVKDDVLVYRMDEDHFLLVVNAANREKLLAHFEEVRDAGEFKATIDDVTKKTAMVAIQGPRAMEVISKFSKEIPTLKKFRFVEKNYLIIKLLVSRTGYTGEDGIEAILPANVVDMAMKMLLKGAGDADNQLVKPAGLGCRDTLRMEAGMPLYGNELTEDIPATASGFGFAINLDKHTDERGEDFIGGAALRELEAQGGPTRVLTGLTLDGKRTARAGMRVLEGDNEVGVVTSACLSPTLSVPIAMAYIDKARLDAGATVCIEKKADERMNCTITPLPFYKAPRPEPAGAGA
ncbi:MAG: glycine cleavage system aminomethyltransferase GcvT [Phycisphaerales bacterium]